MLHSNSNMGGHSPKYKVLVDNTTFEFEKSVVTGSEILIAAGKTPINCHSLYQKLKGEDFKFRSNDDDIDLSDPGIERFTVKEPIVFHYTINNEPELTDQKHLTAQQILVNAGLNVNDEYLVLINEDGSETEYAYRQSEPIPMLCTGLKFISRKWIDIADIEQLGKSCTPVPPAKQYRVRVDKEYFLISEPFTTGRSLLVLANKNPAEKFDIFKVSSSNPQPQKLGLDDQINLREKCLVRFVTLPKEQQDGLLRREVSLPIEDNDFLNAKGLPWEAFSFNGYNWLLIHDYPLPEGYNVSKAQVALMIPPNYPATEIDMVYFSPHLSMLSGRSISAITYMQIGNVQFQRWSRHRAPGEWRPGLDNISTHLLLVNNWLEKELKR